MTTPKHECHSPGKFQVPDTNHGGTPIPSKKKKSEESGRDKAG